MPLRVHNWKGWFKWFLVCLLKSIGVVFDIYGNFGLQRVILAAMFFFILLDFWEMNVLQKTSLEFSAVLLLIDEDLVSRLILCCE